MEPDRILDTARNILQEEGNAILRKRTQLGPAFVQLVQKILEISGRVVVTGLGKSGLIGDKIAATLSSTGTPAHFLKPVDALHGDIGILQPGDLLLAISNSGETEEVLAVAMAAKRLNIPLVAFTGDLGSTLATEGELVIDVGVEKEACPLGLAPTASTTTTLAMGDALAMVLLEARGFTRDQYALFHPGGALGQRLRYLVRDLMRTGDLVPRVRVDATLQAAMEEMSGRENLGVTLVIDGEDRLVGIITDGDLRRIFISSSDPNGLPSRKVEEFMSSSPRHIEAGVSAAEALRIMEIHGITSLAVVDALGRAEGIVHLHDILGRGKFRWTG